MKVTVGVDLGGTHIAAGLVDESLRIRSVKSMMTHAERGFEAVAQSVCGLITELLSGEGLSAADIAAVGIGSPGTPDKKRGVVLYSNNLQWRDAPLGPAVREGTGIRTLLANDADCAAVGEYAAGAGAGCRSMAMITIGTGVGSGIILDGRLFAPDGSCAPEFGHTTLISGGELCTCGRRGCVEAYVSFTALIRDANRMADQEPGCGLALVRGSGRPLDGKIIFDTAAAGDAAAVRLVDRFIDLLGQALINVAHAYGVQSIVIGGGLSRQGKWLTDRLHKIVVQGMYGGSLFAPEIRMASLGNDAGIVGAACLDRYL